MGDRSNVNFVVVDYDGAIMGLNYYMHWGGLEGQLEIVRNVHKRVADNSIRNHYDTSYWLCGMITETIKGGGNTCGTSCGMTIFKANSLADAYVYYPDNEYDIVTFVSDAKKERTYAHYRDVDYDFSVEGLDSLIQAIEESEY